MPLVVFEAYKIYLYEVAFLHRIPHEYVSHAAQMVWERVLFSVTDENSH